MDLYPGPKSALDLWTKRAVERCRFSDPSIYFRDFQEAGTDLADVSGTGSQAIQATRGGTLLLQTGATASSKGGRIIEWNLHASNGFAPLEVGAASEFYFATRLKVTTAIDAQTEAAVYGSRSGGGPQLGVVGSVSATKFVAAGFSSGGNLVSNVNVDTSWHVLELWRYNSVTVFAVDGVPQASGNCYVAVAAPPVILCLNGTTATNRGLEVDALFIAGRRVTT